MVNRWLQQWITACNWIFGALIILAAMLPLLRAPLVAGGITIALAAAVAAVRVRYLRPSAYETAQRLDNESRQSDRIATAVYFWSAADPSPMLLRQREDTVGRVAKLDPESFFPIRMPAKMQWTAGLLATFGVLCAFHASYGPPLPALKAKLAESRAIEATLAPFSRILDSVESAPGRARRPQAAARKPARVILPRAGNCPGCNLRWIPCKTGLRGRRMRKGRRRASWARVVRIATFYSLVPRIPRPQMQASTFRTAAQTVHRKTERTRAALRRFPATSWHRSLREPCRLCRT